ncbi:mtDNA inheritance, partitioning of the mitochondrial organelle [Aspergillus hancockii]|nr:mtDNA inheritance, partitioning of the mitochondrial organelle [Aspergillus hancockii]
MCALCSSLNMHEIVTLQLGQRANYLATHFWNLQESYFTYNEEDESPVDHDVHFRPGVGADGSETFTPRTLIYDLKGAFGTLRKYNALYELSEGASLGQGLWDKKEIIQQQTPILQSDYQKNLDAGLPAPSLTSETVRYWSDYNRLFYHPRSIVQLNDYELNSRIMPFEDWNIGKDLFNDLDKEHDLLDRDVRPFAEECDQLRAIQLFTSSDDAWGGFSANYIDRLRDEYGKKAIWVWAIEDGSKVSRQTQLKRDMNKARSIYSISPQSSLYTPIIDPPSHIPSTVQFDPQSEWHTTALISSAMESVTLPTRLRSFHDFEASLAGDDGTHKIFELQSSVIPDNENDAVYRGPTNETQASEQEASKAQKEFDFDFTYDGHGSSNAHIFNQVQVLRGVQVNRKEGSIPQNDLGLVRKQRFYDSVPMFQGFHAPLAFPILDSYPTERIKLMETVAGRIIGVDEREDLVNGLGEIRESYETEWMSDSEFDDE